jgi:hypothetical protein
VQTFKYGSLPKAFYAVRSWPITGSFMARFAAPTHSRANSSLFGSGRLAERTPSASPALDSSLGASPAASQQTQQLLHWGSSGRLAAGPSATAATLLQSKASGSLHAAGDGAPGDAAVGVLLAPQRMLVCTADGECRLDRTHSAHSVHNLGVSAVVRSGSASGRMFSFSALLRGPSATEAQPAAAACSAGERHASQRDDVVPFAMSD